MSASIDSFIYTGEKPWHMLGTYYKDPPKTAREIVTLGGLDWKVAAAPMLTELHGQINGYNAIYREDNNHVLGVVNKSVIDIVQNTDTFLAVDPLMETDITFETAASLSEGRTVFGCFKISENYKVLDDEIEHYFVIMNEHLRPDGKVTIMNTPIRVVCQNTLTAALGKNSCMMRVPVVEDVGINRDLANKVLGSAGKAIVDLQKSAEAMVAKKVDRTQMDKILDELFPLIKVDGESAYTKANENMEYARETFVSSCMDADNLANYKGTVYIIYNALADYTQHYVRNVNKAYDLDYRMSTILGGADSPAGMVTKFLKMANSMV